MSRPVQVIAKDLILMSYSAVCSCNTTQGDSVSQAIVSPMFDTLSSCAKKCPTFLLGLSREGQPVGEVICSSVKMTPTTLESNEMDIVVSSTRFLIDLISSLKSLSLESFEEDKRGAMVSVIGNIKHTVQNDIIATVVQITCAGISLQGALPSLTDLLSEILHFSQWPDIKDPVSGAIESGPFQLGVQATAVVIRVLQDSAENPYVSSNFRTIISDMWEMHQIDDTGTIAGGEMVVDFVQRNIPA